ncbi:MAG: type II toxin-antitoxin system RatA family toxin, partial [Alphaproteobacteria bacterium]
MPKIVSERDLPHSAERMLDLVSDVEAYPQFVPLCETVHVRERRVEGDVSTLVSEMTVAYALF